MDHNFENLDVWKRGCEVSRLLPHYFMTTAAGEDARATWPGRPRPEPQTIKLSTMPKPTQHELMVTQFHQPLESSTLS